MRQIAIFQSDLKVGGIQKSLLNILETLDYDRVCVDVFLYDRDAFYSIPNHRNLNFYYESPLPFVSRFVLFDLLKCFASMPEPARGKLYDVAIDFNSYRMECALGACKVNARKRVMWIHNDVEIKLASEPKYRVLHAFFRRKYKEFDEFAAVSEGIIEPFRRINRVWDKPIHCIPNHVDTAEIFSKMNEVTEFSVNQDEYNLCSVGRLCYQKGFDILIDEMAKVDGKRKQVHLYIVGDGEEREKLQLQINKLSLQKCVTLLGSRQNVFPILKQMDAFVLTSRYEGQGIAIWEAKALGLELFVSKNLEKYNPQITGTEDIAGAIISAKRSFKKLDPLTEYNYKISQEMKSLLENG